MFDKPFIPVRFTDLMDFHFICDLLRRHTADELAATFMLMLKHQAEAQDDDLHAAAESPEELLSEAKSLPVISLACCSASVWQWVAEVKEHLDDYIWLHGILTDQHSRDTLLNAILSRFFCIYAFLEKTYTPIQYFDWNILQKRENALYVDCGAYDGDSVVNFIGRYGPDYAHIIAYEPTPDVFQALRQSVQSFPRVLIRPAAVGEKAGALPLQCFPNAVLNYVPMDGAPHCATDITVPVVALDQDIDPALKISLLKIDVEGAEAAVLRGAREHIISDRPQLAVCLYHLLDDLRVIPRLIHSYNPEQDFYLRNHQLHGIYDLVFYADPHLGPNEQAPEPAEPPLDPADPLRRMLDLSATVYEGLDYLCQADPVSAAARQMRDLVRQALTVLLRGCEQWTETTGE
ncbi:MAG: FkbM family methyltransferase [Gracilibacteraceae bacterium]|jgi:FkbM family methyltransferase|nr:FkbM family methyltransferase [Gracilibacteraceae bacterium]